MYGLKSVIYFFPTTKVSSMNLTSQQYMNGIMITHIKPYIYIILNLQYSSAMPSVLENLTE